MSTGKSNFRNQRLMEQWTSRYVRPYRLSSWPMRACLFIDYIKMFIVVSKSFVQASVPSEGQALLALYNPWELPYLDMLTT